MAQAPKFKATPIQVPKYKADEVPPIPKYKAETIRPPKFVPELAGVLKDGDKDWNTDCFTCGATPTCHPTKLCGPCLFGEEETAGGNW